MLSLITLIQTKALFIWLQVGCRAYILHLPSEYTRLGRARGKLRVPTPTPHVIIALSS